MTMTSHLHHDALLYDSDDAFVAVAAPFLESGAERGAAIAVTGPRNRSNLHEALGDAAERVAFVDQYELYTRPVDALAAYDSTLRHHQKSGTPTVLVGEIAYGPSWDEWDEWIHYEWVVNRALAPYDLSVICAYGIREFPDRILEGVVQTHPGLIAGRPDGTPPYEASEQFARSLIPRPEPLPSLRSMPAGRDPEALCERLARELTAEEVPEARALDLLVAAKEVALNAWQHARGAHSLRVGRVNGRFVCEIADAGPGLDDPAAGYLPRRPGDGPGAGLWIARRLSSRMELLSSSDGLTVRLWA